MVTLVSRERVVTEPTRSHFRLQHLCASFGLQHFGTVVEDKVQFPNFEDYASLTFVEDYIANSSSQMATPRRDGALVLLQI